MIQIKPKIIYSGKCPRCGRKTIPKKLLWQGIHVCVRSTCSGCSTEFIEDLPIGHALTYPFLIDIEKSRLSGPEIARKWFGEPLLKSLKRPSSDKVNLEVVKKKSAKKVVILNCLDFLYGHSLLKLLNLQDHLENNRKLGIIVIIPRILEWMVADRVSEIWVVDVPMGKAQNYYPDLEAKIEKELDRFDQIYLSRAYSHPRGVDITKFTGTNVHDFAVKKFRVTFVWREDRPWFSNDYIAYGLKKLGLLYPLTWLQNLKVRLLFSLMRRRIPEAKFTVAGIGKKTRFPVFIDDVRYIRPSANDEKRLCKVYSQSRVVIGVHGSNMLLPSAHAGMVVDLVPDIKINNIAQDIIYRDTGPDPRVSSLMYRYLPTSVSVNTLSRAVVSMVKQRKVMLENLLSKKNE